MPDMSGLLKKLAELIPKQNIEKIVFKGLLAIWLIVAVISVILRLALGARNDIEDKITRAAARTMPRAKDKTDIAEYEALLALAAQPEGIGGYLLTAEHDPFSEHKGIILPPSAERKYDFVLKSIDKVALPIVYRGYIELPDRIIGQINWRDTTRFVEEGSVLDGYQVQNITKTKIDALNERGEKLEFIINEPIFGDEFQATLYDRASKTTFDVQMSSVVGEYKVIDIAPNYVILLSKEETLKLEI